MENSHRAPNFLGINGERNTPGFPNGVEGALPSCPSISQVNRVLSAETPHGRSNGRTSDSVRLGFFFSRCEIPVSIRTSQIWLRWFNSALSVAVFADGHQGCKL